MTQQQELAIQYWTENTFYLLPQSEQTIDKFNRIGKTLRFSFVYGASKSQIAKFLSLNSKRTH